MIGFLGGFRYFAIVFVALSVLGSGVMALTFVMFCDYGPLSVCFARAGVVLGIAIFQIVSLVTASVLLKKQRRIRLACALMILSVAPVPVGFLVLALT